MNNYLPLAIAIAFEVLATSTLKSSEQFTKLIPSVIAILGYMASVYFLSLTLKSIPVGIAYAIWSGAGIALIAAVGVIFYQQRLDPPAILGLTLIILGLLTINLFSKTVH